jgi:hypothetical protein
LQQLTDQGRQRIDELAQRYSVSSDAVMTLLRALVNNNGNDSDESLAMMVHDSPSLFEALPGQSGQPSP